MLDLCFAELGTGGLLALVLYYRATSNMHTHLTSNSNVAIHHWRPPCCSQSLPASPSLGSTSSPCTSTIYNHNGAKLQIIMFASHIFACGATYITFLSTVAWTHPMLVMQLAALHTLGSFCSLQAMAAGMTISFLQTMKAVEPLLAFGFTLLVYRTTSVMPVSSNLSVSQFVMLCGMSTGVDTKWMPPDDLLTSFFRFWRFSTLSIPQNQDAECKPGHDCHT